MIDALPIEVRATRALPLGMPATAFLRDYWQQRPLLIREAFADFETPVSPNDLAGLALEPLALSRIVIFDRKKDLWKLETGPFAESRFARTGKRDWTLLVQDVDKWDKDVAALLGVFSFLPRWRIDDIMISYAVEGGSVGAHVDQYDVFLLQGMGHRRWQIDVDPDAPRDFRDDAPLKLLKEFWPTHDFVLAPGDMLYLPPNVPHHGVALDECLTYSIGTRAPAVSEMIGDLADSFAEELDEETRYTDPGRKPARDPFEVDAASITRVRAALSPLLAMDDAALGDWFARFMTRYRAAQDPAPPPKAVSEAKLRQRLGRGDRLCLHPFARMAHVRHGKSLRIHLAGHSFDLSAAAAAPLSADGYDDATFEALESKEQAILLDLVQRGLLVFAKD